MVTLPVNAAIVSGVKVMLMLQLPAGDSGGVSSGQAVVKPKSPLPVMLAITRLAAPLLVSVTVWAGLVVFTVRVPNINAAEESVTSAVGAGVTVRLNGVALLLPPGVTIRPAAMLPE